MIIELADAAVAITLLLTLVAILSFAAVFALQTVEMLGVRCRERAVVRGAARLLRREQPPVSEGRRPPPSGGA